METKEYKVFVKIKPQDKVEVHTPFRKFEGVVEFVGYGFLYCQSVIIFDGIMDTNYRTAHIHKIF